MLIKTRYYLICTLFVFYLNSIGILCCYVVLISFFFDLGAPSGAKFHVKRNLSIRATCKFSKEKISPGNKLGLRVSSRAFQISAEHFLGGLGYRVMVILLQEWNFGPNVIFCLFGIHILGLSAWA